MRLAFVGSGAATRMHSRTLKRVARDVQLRYASRDASRAEALNREMNGNGAFDSYDAAIHDPEVDIVLIATPPVTHLELALNALRAGKHVIVEKPAFLRVSDFDTVMAAERESGRRVFVAENYFYKPLLRALRRIIASDELGEIRFVHVNALKQQKSTGWRDDAALAGGGALFEGGVHWIDFLANLGLEVHVAHGFRAGQRGPERSMLVVLQYANGAVGSLAYSWEIHSPLKGIRMSRIYGTAGAVAFESNGIFMLQTGRKKRFRVPGLRDIAGYRAMFRDFIAAITADKPAEFTLARARRDHELIEQAYRTAGITMRGDIA